MSTQPCASSTPFLTTAQPMSIIAVFGCYERSLFGYEIVSSSQKSPADPDSEEEDVVDEPLQLKQIFSYAPHLGAIKAIATSGKMLVSGGSDEKIKYALYLICSAPFYSILYHILTVIYMLYASLPLVLLFCPYILRPLPSPFICLP